MLVDLETGLVTDSPHGGHECAWSPDGKTIAYLDRWQLCAYDVASAASSVLAWRKPSPGEDTDCPSYFTGPAWSPDACKLAAQIGANQYRDSSGDFQLDLFTLVLDREGMQAFLMPGYADDLTFAPSPRPFRRLE